MSTLDEWMNTAGTAVGLEPDNVDAALRTELLDLTREVAHGVARIAGPLTCYLVGIAVGRGADPHTATADVTAAVARYLADNPQESS